MFIIGRNWQGELTGIIIIGFFLLLWLLLSYFYHPDIKYYIKVFLPRNLSFAILFAVILNFHDRFLTTETALIWKLLLYLGLIGCFLAPLIIDFLQKKDYQKGSLEFLWSWWLMSAIYITAFQFFGTRIEFLFGDYTWTVYPYSAFIILIFFEWIPSKAPNWIQKPISRTGRSTLHILYTQIILLGAMTTKYGTSYFEGNLSAQYGYTPLTEGYNFAAFIYLVIVWIISISIGVVWYSLEEFIRQKVKNRKK